MRGIRRDGESGDQPELISTGPPVTGAALALDGLKDRRPAEDLDRFWLPPPPAGLLDCEELTSRLRRAYMCSAIPWTKAEGVACVA